MAYRVVVLVSGSGTLLQSLIDATGTAHPAVEETPAELPGVEIVGVISDRADAAALTRAADAGVPTEVVALASAADRDAWNLRLRDAVARHDPDLVISAGFMRIVGPPFLERYAGSMINTHPSLLPAFPGRHAVRDALAHGVRVSGATIFMVDEGVDTGRIIAQHPVFIHPSDDSETLHERIKVVERQLLIDTVRHFAEEGRHVRD
ncbi:phosphoribosylglycinamide formyltransferase-1 [Naumannella cuiyingiana]|uniref:Phosphoribosylglycinamide formyltransferase n=1 Tax=Naumannella cuiyingiana TaxID=1347891 RepID=A0A7Z0D7J5_9ACTN|nr:phosphoribosylglycinamide formyltransferase-1 [Naumannella cuiyingiana]